MSIATIDNQLIHYEALGRGQPLLFIHGWLGSWRYWWPSMQALSARQRTFAIDLWGYGDSSKSPELYSLAAYVEMIDRFIDKMGIVQPVTLVGHSLGAAVALRYIKKNLDMVEKLVMVALPLHGQAVNPRLGNTALEAFTKAMGKSGSFSEVDSELRKTDQQAINRLMQELTNLDFSQEIITCPRPVLMVYGGQDQVIETPPNNHAQLQAPENNHFLVSLDECNHFPMLQEKAKFNRLLLDFIHADDSVTELTPKDYWQRRVR
ncbi:MAG: alpha/beta hydrolase [Anaerolineae bacterium]